MSDVFLSHEPAIGTIIREFGETKTRAAVVYLLADALEFFNATNTMNDIQVAMTVDLIIEEYPYMKTDDLKLCFKNAMKMKYGELYNRIDGSVIMGWLKEYNKERCAFADNQSWNIYKSHLAEEAKPTDGMLYVEYRKELENRAKEGDEEAMRLLSLSDDVASFIAKQKLEKQRLAYEEFERNKITTKLTDGKNQNKVDPPKAWKGVRRYANASVSVRTLP